MRIYLGFAIFLAALLGCSEQTTTEDNSDAEKPVEATQGSLDLSTLSLKQLHDRIQGLSARSRQLGAEMQRDVDETKRRLGSRVSDPSSNVEAERIRNTWPPRIQAVEADIRAVMEEVGRRCPKGAVLNSEEQRCI